MNARQSSLEIGPAPRRQPVALLPLGKIRDAFDRLTRRLDQDLAREACRQRIDRLQHRQLVAGFRRNDVVGVRHLQRFAVAFDAARDEAQLADGQLLFDELALGVEENEIDASGIVFARDLVGRFVVAARRRFVFQNPEAERDDRAWYGGGELRFGAAVDDACRHVPEQIDDARLRYAWRQSQTFLQQQDQARADARQGLCRCEERMERSGSHRRIRLAIGRIHVLRPGSRQ